MSMSCGMASNQTTLLTGIPRSGTTLCCHLLNASPNTLALHEPISPQEFSSQNPLDAVQTITAFAASTRREALRSGKVTSKQMDGSVPANPVGEQPKDGLRSEQVVAGVINVDRPLDQTFNLVIKHNALFTALLETLVQQFACYAVIRNPLATLASWQTVDLPIHEGHVPMAEQFDARLRHHLSELDVVLDRQLYILRWFYAAYTSHIEPTHIIRYEDIVETQGAVLAPLSSEIPEASMLRTKNANALYRDLDINQLLDRLLQERDIFAGFYGEQDLRDLAQDIQHQ